MRVIRCTDDDDAQPAHLESDGEADDAEEEADHQWRMQRFEREKFLSEQSTAQDADDSQLLKLGKTVVKPKKGAKSTRSEKKSENV